MLDIVALVRRQATLAFRRVLVRRSSQFSRQDMAMKSHCPTEAIRNPTLASAARISPNLTWLTCRAGCFLWIRSCACHGEVKALEHQVNALEEAFDLCALHVISYSSIHSNSLVQTKVQSQVLYTCVLHVFFSAV